MQRSECFKLLGLEQNASRAEIRKQYRMLAMRYHPDRNQDPNAGELFIKLTEAYEILLNKRDATETETANPRRQKATYEERMQTAKERFEDQRIREQEENERYFNYLTKSRRWKTIRVGSVIGLVLTVMLMLDLFLPHHFTESEITHYRNDVGLSPTGKSIGLIQTQENDLFFLSNMNYTLYNKHRYILIERSWFFHNPIRIISLGKVDRERYEIHFSAYSITWFLSLVFLLPLLTIVFKRKHVFYTILYHASYFGSSALIIYFLLLGHRWAHVLTFGFL